MTDIDVEAVDSVDEEVDADPTDDGTPATETHETVDLGPSGVDAPEYVLYGGKGGVGKTTMAAATALASARDGTPTLVISTDPAHSLSDTFETDVPSRPTRIRDDDPLYAAEIDPDAAMAEGATMFGDAMADDDGAGGATGAGGMGPGDEAGGPMGGLGDVLSGGNPMEALFGGAMPGADEAVAIQKLIEYMDDDRFDRVVIDTAPTGHTLRLLQLPEVMDTMVGRMLSLRERLGGMMDGLKGLFGDGPDDDGDGMEDLEVLRERIERLRATLRDPTRTDFRVVMVPEEMSVVESERLLAQLTTFDIPVGTVVVNRVMEDLADVTDADPEAFVSPNLDTCDFCKRRWDVQQDALQSAMDVFRGHDIKRVPLFADEVRGERMLRVVGACIT